MENNNENASQSNIFIETWRASNIIKSSTANLTLYDPGPRQLKEAFAVLVDYN